MEKVQDARGVCGVGPAERTGKPRSRYCPGGMRALVSSSFGRRPRNPREKNPSLMWSPPDLFSLFLIMLLIIAWEVRESQNTCQTHLFLSHQRNLQICWPVFRLVKRTTINVFAPIKKHVVVDVNEVIVDIRWSFYKTKQRKGFSFYVLHDIDFPRVETIAWKFVRDSGKSLMEWGHLIRFICNVVQVVRAFCNRVLSLPGVMACNHNFHQRHFSIGIRIIHHGTGKSVTRGIRKNS